jgi:exosome complex RNA-binding protein Csl4
LNDRDFVTPGEQLATEEELTKESNIYAENGVLYAAAAGRASIKNGVVSVLPLKTKRRMEPGMLVIGNVSDSLKSVVFVKIDKIEKEREEYVAGKDGKIIIRERREGFRRGRNMYSEPPAREERPCKKGDTVIALVEGENKDAYTLGFRDPNAGVVYSLCEVCGEPLVKGDRPGILACNRCRRIERRRVSQLYGDPEGIKKLFSW